MFITAIAIGATPSSMNAGSVQTPSGRSNVDERRAAATRPDVRASRRLRSASAQQVGDRDACAGRQGEDAVDAIAGRIRRCGFGRSAFCTLFALRNGRVSERPRAVY